MLSNNLLFSAAQDSSEAVVEKKVMSRDETVEFVYSMFINSLPGERKVDVEQFRGKLANPEYFEYAVNEAMQLTAEKISEIPDRLGLDFEQTEKMRKLTDDMLASIALQVRHTLDKLYSK